MACSNIMRHLLLALLLGSAQALAQQSYPTKPIRIIVGFAPGGASDILARALGQLMGDVLEQQVIIDNRPGAGGVVAAELGMRAAPDGYTLLQGSPGAFAVNPNLMQKIPYDPLRDFAPVGLFATLPYVVGVHPSLPVRSLSDMIALAKSKPGQITYGAGQGTNAHLAIEQFSIIAGIKMTHVPYKGNAPALIALMSGEIVLVFDPLTTSLPLVKSGRMRPIAVTSIQRSALLPDVPTVSESAIKDFVSINWFSIFAPAKTPRAVVDRLNAAMKQSMQNPSVKRRFLEQGADAVWGTPEELGELVKRDLANFARVIKDARIRAE